MKIVICKIKNCEYNINNFCKCFAIEIVEGINPIGNTHLPVCSNYKLKEEEK